MGNVCIPGIGKVGAIENMTIETLSKFSQGIVAGAILDKAEEVVYTLKVDCQKKIKNAKMDGEWAKLTTDRYAGKILSDPRTVVTLDKGRFGSIYFRQMSHDGFTEAVYRIKRWKDETRGSEEPVEAIMTE